MTRMNCDAEESDARKVRDINNITSYKDWTTLHPICGGFNVNKRGAISPPPGAVLLRRHSQTDKVCLFKHYK